MTERPAKLRPKPSPMATRPTRGWRGDERVIVGIFAITGAVSLTFEALWFRQAGLALGNSVWATTLVLGGFMAGLAVGNVSAARFADRLAHPLRVYAGLEAGVALMGVALVFALPSLGRALAGVFGPLLETPWLLNPLRLATAFGMLLLPSAAMGATLPLLSQELSARDPRFGGVLGRLYGWNTVGAVVGVLTTEFLWIERLGIRGTALGAGAVGCAAAVVVAYIAARGSNRGAASERESTPDAAPTLDGSSGAGGTTPWLVAAFVSGFALLALEVVWFRGLLLFVRSDATSFAVMLAVVLAGIGVGGLVAGATLRRVPGLDALAPSLAFLAATACLISTAALPWFRPADRELVGASASIARIAIPLMGPVSFLSGALFTAIGLSLRRKTQSAARATGQLAFANTLGAALGSVSAGFLLLPAAGMEASILLLSALYAALGVLLLPLRNTLRPIAGVAALAASIAALLFPYGVMRDLQVQVPLDRYLGPGGGRVVDVRESPSETIVYLEHDALDRPHAYRMVTNGYSMSASFDTARRYMKLYVYWPVAVHPRLESALLISYGVGMTAKALTDTASLERIDVVDISRDVLEMNHIVYPDPETHPLNDPRVHVHIEDGRYFLETTERRFDLITGEPPPPNARGVVNLYTREYFERIHARLSERGIATYWLPIHDLSDAATLSILRAFCDAFADCSLWHGMASSLMMVGTRGAAGPVTQRHFVRQWRDPQVAPEMAVLGFEDPRQLGALFIGDAAWLAEQTKGHPALTDDAPKRIVAPNRHGEGYPALFRRFWDEGAARERFAASPLIERLWPPALRDETLGWFGVQGLINRYANGFFKTRDSPFPELHRVLTDTELVTPALWMLGSSRDLDPLLADDATRASGYARDQYFVGLRLLAERDWGGAAKALAVGEAHKPVRQRAFQYRMYALCRAGRCGEAEAIARRRFAARGASPARLPLSPFWMWMGEEFGLDPHQPAASGTR